MVLFYIFVHYFNVSPNRRLLDFHVYFSIHSVAVCLAEINEENPASNGHVVEKGRIF